MEHNEAGSGLQDLTSREADYQHNPLKSEKGTINVGNMSLCASPGGDNISLKRRKTSDSNQSLGDMLRHAIMDHQLGITLNLLFLLALTYTCFPSLRDRLEPFFKLQHALPSGQYLPGPQDTWIVLGYIVLFTGVRAACMDYIFKPLAKACGISKSKAQLRFTEQAYLLLYYIVIWTWGVKLFVSDTPSSNATTILSWFNDLLLSIWKDFPRLTVTASMKAYYLIQTAFWVQQIIVIHLEEPRKDHWQMLSHHFITAGLLIFSYSFRQMRAGNAILVLMDVVDLVFPLAKCLRYLGLRVACDIAFGVFVLTWCLARHVAYMAVVYSTVFHIGHEAMYYGTYSTADSSLISTDGGHGVLENLLQALLNPDAETVSFNTETRSVFIALLGGLQVLTCIWFVMICRVVVRVLRGENAEDSRSDDEDADDVEEAQSPAAGSEQKFIEIVAEAEDLYYPPQRTASGRVTATKRKSKGISSGLNLGEHKDILNRIGCLSEEQLAREAERRHESTSPQPRPIKTKLNGDELKSKR